MTDIRALKALLGDRYEASIETAAASAYETVSTNPLTWDELHNDSRYPWRRCAEVGLAAVLPDILARAWDEGAKAACADPYHPYGMCEPPHVNPYRTTEGDPS